MVKIGPVVTEITSLISRPLKKIKKNKKHLKNVGPIRHCEPPHAACFTLPFTRCLQRIDVHNNINDNNDNNDSA